MIARGSQETLKALLGVLDIDVDSKGTDPVKQVLVEPHQVTVTQYAKDPATGKMIGGGVDPVTGKMAIAQVTTVIPIDPVDRGIAK